MLISAMSRQLYVFGSNGEGQLGITAADIINVPTLILDSLPLEHLQSIQSGDNHTLLQISNADIYGAGSNHKGQIAPHQATGNSRRLEQFQRLGTGYDFVAATCESSAYLSTDNEASPRLAATSDSLRLAAQFKCQKGQPCTLVWTRGFGQWGELGRGSTCMSTVGSSKLESLEETIRGTVIDFAAGVWHYMMILDDGKVYGWGKARLGQLGDKLEGKITKPTRIEGLPFQPNKVVCGKDFTYLVGDPATGEHLVLGHDKFSIVSGKPDSVKGWKDIGATWHAIFVLLANGTLIAWGKENMWQLIPPNLPLISRLAVGSDHVLALTLEGKLISWGWGKHGNCGNLAHLGKTLKNDMLSGFWNEIPIPGNIEMIFAGYCTSFVVARPDTKEEVCT